MLVSDRFKLVCMGDESINDKSIKNLMTLLGFKESTVSYDEYRTFILLINPYQKVLNFYMNVVLSSVTPIFKDKKNDYIKYFREWVYKIFHHEKLIIKLSFEGTSENYTKILSNFKIEENINNLIVRDEKLVSDLNKIDSTFDIKPIDFQYKWKLFEFYDYETAKIIFEFYKNEFFIGEYDPFSFSNEIFTNDKKIEFIHNPF